MELFQDSLEKAVLINDVESVEQLLSERDQLQDDNNPQSIKTIEYLSTSLFKAVTHGHLEMVQLLVRKGADVNYENAFKQSVLSTAILGGNGEERLDVLKYILQKGSNINHKTINGQTDAMHLIASGKLTCAYLTSILDSVENIDEHDYRTGGSYLHVICTHPYDEHKTSLIEKLLERGLPINGKDNNDDTPLHLVGSIACCQSLKFLLQKGADIRATNRLGEMVLHSLASSNEIEGFEESLNVLIDSGVDINTVDFKGRSAIHHALLSKDTDISGIRTLLKYGANINVKDYRSRNEMHFAVNEFNVCTYTLQDIDTRTEVIKFLASLGVHINEGDEDGVTPLHFATMKDDLDILVMLLDLGADITMKTKTGATPLHWACQFYNMVHVLIHWHAQNDQDLNTQDTFGSTALHWAVWFRSFSAIQSLLQEGADVDIKDNSGNSPSDLALKLNYNDFSVLLKTYTTLEPKELKDATECHGSDPILACPLLRYIRKVNGDILSEEYIVHARPHETIMKEFINTVLEYDNMGLYYNIDENQTIPNIFKGLMDMLVHRVEYRIPLFQGKLSLAGSLLEGTKVKLTDEFDYLWELEEFSKAFVPVESNTYPKGFVKLLLNHDLSTETQFRRYIDKNNFLNCRLFLRHFYSVLNEELEQLLKDPDNDQFKPISCVKPLDDIHSSISNFIFLFFGQNAKMMKISVDVVPTIRLGKWLPEKFVAEDLLMLQTLREELQFSAVFKTPERFHVNNYNMFYRLSYAYMEQHILKKIPRHIKKGYILLKAMAESGYFPRVIDHDNHRNVKQYVTSYQLKTCFLHLLELSSRDGSLDAEKSNIVDEKSIGIKWARNIVNYYKTCIENGSLPSYFDREKNLIGVIGIEGVYDQEVFQGLISLFLTLLDMY